MKKNIRCIIVDDEPIALSLLEKYVLQTPFLEFVGKCNHAIEVLNYLDENDCPDLIFMDIQMPDLNGIDLSKSLPNDIKIVFTTAFDRFAVDSYKVNTVDYLLKPFDYTEFLSAAQKVQKLLINDEVKTTDRANASEDYFFIKSEYKQIKIFYRNIQFIEGLKDYVKIYLIDVDRPIMSLISLKKLEEKLPKDRFMRIHRSYIIAMSQIESIERSQVIIRDQRITVAEQYKAKFDDFLSNKRF